MHTPSIRITSSVRSAHATCLVYQPAQSHTPILLPCTKRSPPSPVNTMEACISFHKKKIHPVIPDVSRNRKEETQCNPPVLDLRCLLFVFIITCLQNQLLHCGCSAFFRAFCAAIRMALLDMVAEDTSSTAMLFCFRISSRIRSAAFPMPLSC